MTANHEHTPLDDLVLRMHIHFGAANTMGDDHSADDFANVIRVLENMPAKIAAAEQRGAERALLRAERLMKEDRAELGETVSTQLMIDWLRILAGQPINYSADQEGDDE